MSSAEGAYAPGACNIGAAEIRLRWIAGYAGSAATVIVWIALAWGGLSAAWYAVLALPAMLAATGFIQAQARFCVHFGLRHMFNFDDVGSATDVEDAAARRLDRRRAWQIVGMSAAIAAVVAMVGVMTAL